jgi:hypothetical protein
MVAARWLGLPPQRRRAGFRTWPARRANHRPVELRHSSAGMRRGPCQFGLGCRGQS